MTKKNIDELRAKRDAALASLQAARTESDRATAAAIEAQNESAGFGHGFDGIEKTEHALKVVVTCIAATEAHDATRAAALAASAAVDAFEVAEADELMTTCDAASLQKDLRAELAGVESLRAQIRAAEQRADQRRDAVDAAWNAVASRRAAAGLPPPLAFAAQACREAQTNQLITGKRITTQDFLEDLDARIERAVFAPSDASLHRLREEEMQLRAGIERQKREVEEKEARQAEWERQKNETRESDSRSRRAQQDAAAADQEAQRKANEELAEAHRKRASA